MQNLLLDPVKKDYVIKNGSPIPTDRVLEACYYALMIPSGKYLYWQDGQGSLLYSLYNQKRTSSIEQNFSAYAQDAIDRQVVQTGQATDVDVSNLQATRNGTSNQINVVPSQIAISDQLNFVSV